MKPPRGTNRESRIYKYRRWFVTGHASCPYLRPRALHNIGRTESVNVSQRVFTRSSRGHKSAPSPPPQREWCGGLGAVSTPVRYYSTYLQKTPLQPLFSCSGLTELCHLLPVWPALRGLTQPSISPKMYLFFPCLRSGHSVVEGGARLLVTHSTRVCTVNYFWPMSCFRRHVRFG